MTDPSEIEVRINGDNRMIPTDLSVTGLLEWLDLNPALVVVELNREILDRGRYDEVSLVEKDNLELVHFVGGG
jgi:thiamine biosynthesis protein ThiS